MSSKFKVGDLVTIKMNPWRKFKDYQKKSIWVIEYISAATRDGENGDDFFDTQLLTIKNLCCKSDEVLFRIFNFEIEHISP